MCKRHEGSETSLNKSRGLETGARWHVSEIAMRAGVATEEWKGESGRTKDMEIARFCKSCGPL